MSIPKILHQIWVGPNPPPEAWLRTFRRSAKEAGWKYILWDEARLVQAFGDEWPSYPHYAWLINEGVWYGASDVMRYKILGEYGGWYFDADCEMLNPEAFYNADYQDGEFVLGMPVAELRGRVGRLPSTVIGASTTTPILRNADAMVSQLSPDGSMLPCWDRIGGTLLTRAMDRLDLRFDPGTIILPAKVFYPYNIDGTPAPNAGPWPTVSVHRWGTTFSSYAGGQEQAT